MNRIVLGGMLAFVLVAGCNKKAKETVPDSAPPPAVQSLPPKLPSNTSGGTNSGAVSPGAVGGGGGSSGSLSVGGGGGAVQNIRQAARRTEALNEMRTLGQEIALLQNELGRMPTKDQIMTALKTNSKLWNAINDGSFILTGTMEAGGLWAYEVDADVKPGIALIGGTAMRSTPEDILRYLPKK
jgi:hypothetical protein